MDIDITLPVLNPVCFSHGTLEVKDLPKTQKFYKEFLGISAIRHAPQAMGASKGGDWFIACVSVGENATPQPYANRWGLDVKTPDEVDAARAAALAQKEQWGIQVITDISYGEGERYFALQDLDGNWWEIIHRDPAKFDKIFARGDVA